MGPTPAHDDTIRIQPVPSKGLINPADRRADPLGLQGRPQADLM